MSANEMSTAKIFLVIAGVLLIGPAMFVTSRYMSLGARFEKVKVGDSPAIVKGTMGTPGEEAHEGLYLHGDTEYHYWVWPIPEVWVVSFKDGKVVEKDLLSSP